jgi:hypothetical protein
MIFWNKRSWSLNDDEPQLGLDEASTPYGTGVGQSMAKTKKDFGNLA